ncbi:uncharacterized protein Z518_01321 [Rhinocladiella mackenziei CBS 650.93]|uniref:Uncharacterized protein n=1 Tax=Rhinocladiella mackenziei CBS 650.93 TaxID=1442369 RepID=A0A0D2JLA3_9EURO|nr:uncharacterized protein Z518_01321 [Rhinocladiella mackenziei CBS 650.93]KIX10240.1 hypothetical protein Z518_01321 [Rhinocladiella mackenziei CBS 650.93]
MPARRSGGTKATPASARVHKRQLSETPATTTPGSRVSKRLKESAEKAKSSGATPTKSKYFEEPDSEDADDPDDDVDGDDDSGYEDEDASGTEDQPAVTTDEEEDDYDSDADRKKRKFDKKTAGSKSVVVTLVGKDKELWRPGVKTGLGPGKQVFIEKPKPRGDGGIKYVPEKIHPNTMAFLKDLNENNDREWLKMHDPDYRQSWKDWESFVETLTERISELDETIPELPPKDLVFRIYRDIRFSPDPTPYKPHFSAAWSRTGRKGPYACYYVQIQPGGKSLVGSGLWMPEAQPLALLRTNIDRKPRKLRRVLIEPQLRKQILGVTSNDEKKAIKAFAAQNSEYALKTKPKGSSVPSSRVKYFSGKPRGNEKPRLLAHHK